jgi:phosphatidylserine/phosphatidylglycerophosphate/cardiolipin synthase-like enzyme
MGDERLLTPGQTCWRIAHADQFACIIDAADYFKHVKAAMLRARHRIMLVSWDLDARMTFERGVNTLPGPNQLGAFLYWMLWKRPALEIYLLKSNLRLLPAFDGIWFGLTPVALVNQMSSKRMHFAIDGAHPIGAVHHQKIAVIDDAVAFCGGVDLTVDRWDTRAHQHDSRSRRTMGRSYGPRHEVAAAVDGAAARALGEQARTRWRTATDQSLAPVDAKHTAWPRRLEPTLRNVDIGIARTLPELEYRREVREVEALNLAASRRHATPFIWRTNIWRPDVSLVRWPLDSRKSTVRRSPSSFPVEATTPSSGERWTVRAIGSFKCCGPQTSITAWVSTGR